MVHGGRVFKAAALASFVAVPATCAMPYYPPPAPMGAVTVADGTEGHQGYGGVQAGFLSAFQFGWRYQPNRWVAVDVQSVVGVNQPFALSPGVWFTATHLTRAPRHAFAMRAGPVVGVGSLFYDYSDLPFPSVGFDSRLQYTFRWAPRGMLHLTFQYGYSAFVGLGLSNGYHIGAGTVGVDIPAGPAAVVFSTTGSNVMGLDFQVGLRFGSPSDTTKARERRAAKP